MTCLKRQANLQQVPALVLVEDVLLVLLVLVELVLDCSILVLLVLAKNICAQGANVLLNLSVLVCLALQDSADKADLQRISAPSVIVSDTSNAICMLCRRNSASFAA